MPLPIFGSYLHVVTSQKITIKKIHRCENFKSEKAFILCWSVPIFTAVVVFHLL
jgi:hypothetical protein